MRKGVDLDRDRSDHFDALSMGASLSLRSDPQVVATEAPLTILRRQLPHVVRTIAPSQHLSMEGEITGQVMGVVSGIVRCFRMTPDGRRHISRFATPGSIIGLGPLGVQRYSAEAVNDAQVAYFRADTIELAVRTSDVVRDAIMRALAEELNQGARCQTRLGCLSAEQRVADFLLDIPSVDTHRCVPIEMPRADIADHLGITIETVSRALNRFAKLGLIELINPHKFRIPNTARLLRLVQGEEPEPTRLGGRA